MTDNRKSDWCWTLLVAVAPTLVTELFNTARWATELVFGREDLGERAPVRHLVARYGGRA